MYNEIVASMSICGDACVDLAVMEELLNSSGKSKCSSGSLFFMWKDVPVEVVFIANPVAGSPRSRSALLSTMDSNF